MDKIIKIKFKNIPVESRFAVFDKEQKGSTMTWDVESGDTELEVTIPAEWQKPFRNLRTKDYFIPDSYTPINILENKIEITGGAYYIDVNRETLNEELNQRSVETLIHGIFTSDDLDGRQKFFISLISLQSYFEHLVYGMLVQSAHISNTQFNNLNNHAARTPVAFLNANTDFFSNQIQICPGKENLGTIISGQTRNELENIFNEIRTLRNKVVHKWGYKDIGQQSIKDIFQKLGENINLNESDDDFYKDASFVCIRLYARSSSIKNQLSLFNEKEIVKAERKSRGY